MMKVSRGSKGFTLIELLIVVAIIGILAAIAIPAYSGYTTKSKVAGVVHTMGAIKNAVLAYYTEVGPQGGNVFVAAVGHDDIPTILNVTAPEQYAHFSISTAGRITATFDTGNSVGGGITATDTLTLTPDLTVDPWVWSWAGSTNAAQYAPKGN